MIPLNIDCTKENWILRKLALEIYNNKPEDFTVTIGKSDPNVKNIINYYIAYHQFKKKTMGIDVSFLTHPENDKFYNRAKDSNYCIVMCQKYKNELIQRNIPEKKINLIYPGVDEKYKPRVRILQPVKMEDEKRRSRKGYDLWQKLKEIPYLDCICTEGTYTEDQMIDLFRSVDAVVFTSMLEGGPMGVIEGLYAGCLVIAPKDVGFIDDFSGSVTYTKGHFEELKNILDNIYNNKLKIHNNVKHLTWKYWAEQHYSFFRKIYKDRFHE